MYVACGFMCVYVCNMYVPGADDVLKKIAITWDWSFGCLWATMWVLGTEPRSFASETIALYYRAISPANEATIDKTEMQISQRNHRESRRIRKANESEKKNRKKMWKPR